MTETDGGETVSEGSTALPAAVVEDLRASERRRHLLACLAERDDSLVVEDLARCVAGRERGAAADAVSADAVDTARRDIYEHHLPKLTATAVVSYDSLLGTVELATDDDRLLGTADERAGYSSD